VTKGDERRELFKAIVDAPVQLVLQLEEDEAA
jgi:hypothetical protein